MLKCNICNGNVKYKFVLTRSKKNLKINVCYNCDYEFFKFEKKNNLKKNKLDNYRLSTVGLKKPTQKEDFLNGLKQSEEYATKHLTIKKLNILEIGSSWGYFLLCAKKRGHNCTGIEINEIRRNYTNKNLKINCFENIEELKSGKFDKIFLFYSLEYISDPLNYLKKLKNYYLKKGGEIIIYTPNKNDHLNCLTDLKEYNNFFYEENSINYFSQNSLINLCKKITKKYKIILIQGYSIFNFINWLLHKKPFSTGYVGKDDFINEIISKLKPKIKFQKNLITIIKSKFIKIDFFFKRNLILNNISNIILLKIK